MSTFVGEVPDAFKAIRRRKINMLIFSNMPAERRLAHFYQFAPQMCSSEWRGKFKRFIGITTFNEVIAQDPRLIEIREHSHIEKVSFGEPDDIPGCQQCRNAFWNLVDTTALDW